MTPDFSRPMNLTEPEPALGAARGTAGTGDRSCPPHRWDCPVLTKLDPLAIAWTCRACGAIVTTPVGAPRPDAQALAHAS
jgi:hypothetical protein